MITKKRIISLLLAMVFVVGLFAGCESREPDVESSTSSTESSASSKPEEKNETVGQITPEMTASVIERKESNDNNDTVGWLSVPQTSIDDVVVWTDTSNQFYERKNFEKQYDWNGIFFADRRSAFHEEDGFDGTAATMPSNLVIYGHALTDNPEKESYKIKFGPLHDLRDPEFAKEVPYIFYSTEKEDMAFEVFALLVVNADNPDVPYNIPNQEPEGFFKMIQDEVLPRSVHDYDVELKPDDKFITLSTCIYRLPGKEDDPEMPYPNYFRYAVMGRLVEKDAPLKEKAELKVNEDILLDPNAAMGTAK